MSESERLLNQVLSFYLDVHDDERTNQILGTTTALLTRLSNPHNVTLLTSQLLTAPAIWRRGHDQMETCFRILSIFNTAAIQVVRSDGNNPEGPRPYAGLANGGSGMRIDTWSKAVAKGADEGSDRWQHVLVLSGVLMGLASRRDGERDEIQRRVSHGLRKTFGRAVITAVNLALLESSRSKAQNTVGPVVLALNYAFPHLADELHGRLECNLLLPAVVRTMLGADGLQSGLFLGAINLDVQQSGQQLHWPESSASFQHMSQLETRPVVYGLGPLARLARFAIERAKSTAAVVQVQDGLVLFTAALLDQWRANKLSEFEFSEATVHLNPQTLRSTWPALWHFLKRIMYGIVAVLQAVVSRSLLDPKLQNDLTAPMVATKSLRILRNLYFVSSQRGNDAFQIYSFTYLASVDTLARYANASAAFLREILPACSGSISPHPLHRTLDLFFLNLAEHLPLKLPSQACDTLIIQPAVTYLTHSAPLSPRMVELFEAAHSAVLAVISCGQNATLTARLAPFYVETLFVSFPSHISPRQFRLAFKTMMQVVSPPFPISASHPDLAETLLEMVRFQAHVAGTAPLPAQTDRNGSCDELTSEQSALVITMIDALPYLQLDILEGWMAEAARALQEIVDPRLREMAQRRVWNVLSTGEMDVERAAIGVAWWGTKGGREAVLYGRTGGQGKTAEQYLMRGALGGGKAESRL